MAMMLHTHMPSYWSLRGLLRGVRLDYCDPPQDLLTTHDLAGKWPQLLIRVMQEDTQTELPRLGPPAISIRLRMKHNMKTV